jgi:hypothetical protein
MSNNIFKNHLDLEKDSFAEKFGTKDLEKALKNSPRREDEIQRMLARWSEDLERLKNMPHTLGDEASKPSDPKQSEESVDELHLSKDNVDLVFPITKATLATLKGELRIMKHRDFSNQSNELVEKLYDFKPRYTTLPSKEYKYYGINSNGMGLWFKNRPKFIDTAHKECGYWDTSNNTLFKLDVKRYGFPSELSKYALWEVDLENQTINLVGEVWHERQAN